MIEPYVEDEWNGVLKNEEMRVLLIVGVLADTHVPDRQPEIPKRILDGLKGVDMIIHAGDLTSLEVVRVLENIAPVKAVRGNVDPPRVSEQLPESLVVDILGHKIAVFHGGGSPFETVGKARTFQPSADCVIFGHTHEAFNERFEKRLLFNPGSASETLWTKASYGLLYLRDAWTPIEGQILS